MIHDHFDIGKTRAFGLRSKSTGRFHTIPNYDLSGSPTGNDNELLLVFIERNQQEATIAASRHHSRNDWAQQFQEEWEVVELEINVRWVGDRK